MTRDPNYSSASSLGTCVPTKYRLAVEKARASECCNTLSSMARSRVKR